MKTNDVTNSNCPIARAMTVLGEGWTLLVLREAFLGTRRFNDFERRLGVARNVLSARLGRLVDTGLLERRPLPEDGRVIEYRLTQAGRELAPVMVAMSQWSMQWLVEQPEPIRYVERATGEDLPPVQIRNRHGEVLAARDIQIKPGPGADCVVQHQYSTASVRPHKPQQ
ncbi:MAG: helix-turn-helix domain-containing protein [Natronospirillum sp.]